MYIIEKTIHRKAGVCMKRNAHFSLRRTVAGVIVCLLVVMLCGCGKKTVPPVQTPMPAAEGLRIAVASDLHFNPDASENVYDQGSVKYNTQLVDALLHDVESEGADVLLLTGDLVNSGRTEHHRALAEKLRTAADAGVAVYVLPGNHDLAPIGQQEFAALYGEFGYNDAHSRDSASLSYCIMRSDVCLLMLDTGGYPADTVDLPDAPQRENDTAYLSESTLQWAHRMMQEAEQRALPVLCAGHYNLLTAESRDETRSGLYLENGSRLAQLLRACHVPLYLSGHVHTRMVMQERGLTELVTEYLLSYPTGYSMLDLTAVGITYTPRRVDVDAWAAETGQRDRVLTQFREWQQDELRAYAGQNVEDMAERNPPTRREKQQAAEFFYAVMDAYWRGDLAAEREALLAMPGCEPFFRCAEGYAYRWWLRELIDTATPMIGGFQLNM